MPQDDVEEDGVELVLRTLRALENPPAIGDEIADDVDALADLLLDHGPHIDIRHLLYCLTCLVVEDIDEVVRVHCEAEHLLLIEREVADATIAEIFRLRKPTTRRRPFSTWKIAVMRDVVERVRHRDEYALYANMRDGAPQERALAALACVMIRLDRDARHISWLSWAENRSMAEISKLTLIPLERVEWILEEVVARVTAIADGAESKRDPDEIGGSNFWRQMEDGDHA